MRKNQDNDAPKKAREKALKTDSEKKESVKKEKASKKPEPKLNDPLYDVNVKGNGDTDVVSEKAIDEVDYPPELAEFLGETLLNLRDQLGLKEGEDFPEGFLKDYFTKFFQQVDLDQLLEQLRLNVVPENDEESDDDVDVDDYLTDEMLANIDFTKLDVDELGNRILSEFTLIFPEDETPAGVLSQDIPIKLDEEMIKNHVVFRVYVPYIEKVPLEKMESKLDGLSSNDYSLLMDEENAHLLYKSTFNELLDILERTGVTAGNVANGDGTSSRITEYTESGGVAPGDFSAREDGYYDDLREYWYDGVIYHENDVIWLEIPRTISLMGTIKGFSANLDSFAPIFHPCDIGSIKGLRVENNRRVLSNEEKFEIFYYNLNQSFYEMLTPSEEIWHIASEFAKTKDAPGYCVVCKDGRFNVPVESFFNPVTYESEDLIELFNVIKCLPNHHLCAGLVIADIGNMQMQTGIRYCKNKTFDWQERINQEIEMYQVHNPNYSPYDDPYDNPYDSGYDDDDY